MLQHRKACGCRLHMHGCTRQLFPSCVLPERSRPPTGHQGRAPIRQPSLLSFSLPHWRHGSAGRRRFRITKLPRFLVLHIKRFLKNQFFVEKNPTIVNFPVKNLDLAACLPVPTGTLASLASLAALLACSLPYKCALASHALFRLPVVGGCSPWHCLVLFPGPPHKHSHRQALLACAALSKVQSTVSLLCLLLLVCR